MPGRVVRGSVPPLCPRAQAGSVVQQQGGHSHATLPAKEGGDLVERCLRQAVHTVSFEALAKQELHLGNT